jgi:hypothetical protein
VAGWEERNCIKNKNHSQQDVLGRRSKFRETLIALQFSLWGFSSGDMDKNDWYSQNAAWQHFAMMWIETINYCYR